MAPLQGPNEGSVKTAVHLVKTSEMLDPDSALSHAIYPQHPKNTHLEGHLRVPPTAATRKYRPARSMYDDFETAHSSITSKSVNGRSKKMSYKSPKKQHDLGDRGRPLPRRMLKSLRRPKRPSHKDEELAMPTPAKVSPHRPISEFDFDLLAVPFTLSRQPEVQLPAYHSSNMNLRKEESAPTFFGGLRNTINGRSSPLAKSVQSRNSYSFKQTRDNMALPGLARKVDQHAGGGMGDKSGTRSLVEPGDLWRPNNPPCLDDPFVHVSSQDAAQLRREGTNAIQECGAGRVHQNDWFHVDFYDKNDTNLGPGILRNGTLVQGNMDTPSCFHGNIAPAVESRSIPSTRESSTLGNIVKQYARNHRLWDISLDSNDDDSEENSDCSQNFRPQERAPDIIPKDSVPGFDDNSQRVHQSEDGDAEDEKLFRSHKLEESSGHVPVTGLPQIPSLVDRQVLKTVSAGLGKLSPHTDAHNVVNIEPSPWIISTGPNEPYPRTALLPSQTFLRNANPFYRGLHFNSFAPSSAHADSSPSSHLSQEIKPVASGSTEDFGDKTRQTLERDVSRALRRMSSFSNLSQDTAAQDVGDGGFQSSTDSGSLLEFIDRPVQSSSETPKVASRGFYHESAISETWFDPQRIERVRIPIGRRVSGFSFLLASHSASSATDEFDPRELYGLEQNGNDWETVVTGVVGKVDTTGSLANNYSAENTSPIFYEYSDFSSTDKIVQHPAQIDYSHDYRYREIKDGNFPVLLPSYKPHTVNGFPANSYRSVGPFQQPSGDSYQSPPPLPRVHTNPFRSLPPEVIDNRRCSSEALGQNGFLDDQPSKPKLGVDTSWIVEGGDSENWMDGFGDPGPAIKLTQTKLFPATNHCSSNSLSESYFGSQVIGSSIADASSLALSAISYNLEPLTDAQKGGSSNFNYLVECVDGTPSTAREWAPFIKGPPGAFYQGVRARPDARHNGLSLGRRAVARPHQTRVSQNYPTNKLRPLSLLQVQQAEPVKEADGSLSGERPHEDFSYRSPLAPIKSRSWCDLYTREQLSSMHSAAKDGDINDLEYMSQRSFYQTFDEAVKTCGSWKQLPWSPHMRPWPHDNSSIKTHLAGRKLRLSILFFGFCCLFPPMLVLYGIGYLDVVMLWITQGEIGAFSKAYKRAAIQVVCFFVIAILVAVPVVVAVKVSSSK